MVSAWVFVVWGKEKYLVGAITGAASLRQVNTCHRTVLLYSMTLAPAFLKELSVVFDELVPIDILRFKVNDLRTEKQRELYGGEFSETTNTKWRCLGLTKYQKVMYVDSDIVFQRNSDFLFSMPTPAATWSNPFSETFSRGGFRNPLGRLKHGQKITPDQVRECLEDSTVAAGSLVLLTPERGVLEAHIKWMHDHSPYGHTGCNSGIDEQSLCEFYADRGETWTHIDPIYQAIPWKGNWLPGVKDFLTRAFALHFMHDRPFETGKGTGWPDTKIFWRIYHQMEHDYPRLAKRVRPLIGYYEP